MCDASYILAFDQMSFGLANKLTENVSFELH